MANTNVPIDCLLRQAAQQLRATADLLTLAAERLSSEPAEHNGEAKLDEIIALIKSKPDRPEKEFYSVREVSQRTKVDGVRRYCDFSIRQACSLGLLPAKKKR